MSEPRHWWWRPLRAVLIGLLIGGVISLLIDQLPQREGAYVLMTLCLGMLAWLMWELKDLKRAKRELDQALEELTRLGRDEP